jgi:hypothetical protein
MDEHGRYFQDSAAGKVPLFGPVMAKVGLNKLEIHPVSVSGARAKGQ